MSEPFIVHSHIPKTGGSALNQRVLFPMHGEDRVYPLYRYVFETASRLPRRHVARAMRSEIAVGHIPFGYFDEIYPEAVYISVFREPISRFVSFLNFVLANHNHAVRERLEPDIVAHAADDPDRFIAAVQAEPRLAVVHPNVQVRLASGAPRLGECQVTQDHLRAALRNVFRDRYISGLQEDMPALISRLQSQFHTVQTGNAVAASLEKRLEKTLHLKDLSPTTLDRLRAANDLDLRLYAAVTEQQVSLMAAAA